MLAIATIVCVPPALATSLPGTPVQWDFLAEQPTTTEPLIQATWDFNSTCTVVPPALFGVNTLFFSEKEAVRAHPGYQSSLISLGPIVMRYPAGTAGENYLWKTNSLARPDWYPRRSDPQVDADTTAILELAARHSAKLLMVINYRTFAAAAPDKMEPCYRNALDWVGFVNQEKQAAVRDWEFGNEVYFRNLSVDPEHYGRSYSELRRRLRKSHPSVRLGLVMAHFWSGGPALTEHFNERVVAAIDGPSDFAILHFYPHVTTETLARDGMGMRTKIRHFRRNLREHGLPYELPIQVTEWNASSQATQLRGQTIGHLLCIAQGILELSDAQVESAVYWPLHNMDKGLLNDPPYTLKPAGQLMAHLRQLLDGATRTHVQLSIPTPELEVAAFRKSPEGPTHLILLNRDPHRQHHLQLNNLPQGTSATLTTLFSQAAVQAHTNINAHDLILSEQSIKPSAGRPFRLHLPPLSFNVFTYE